MSLQICLRCLSRPSAPCQIRLVPTTTKQTAAFTTSTPHSAAGRIQVSQMKPKRTGNKPVANRPVRVKRLSPKNVPQRTGRPPAPGERKALRKRVVLSNTNALEVQGMPDLNPRQLFDKSMHGSVVGLPDDVVDPLRVVEAFKPTQGWSLFRRPATLVRSETVEMATWVQEVHNSQEGKTVRKVLFGERGSGKSVLLLQAMAMAFSKGWIVVNFPEAKDLTIGHTSYVPLYRNNQLYIQPHYTASLLAALPKANPILADLRPSREHNLPISVPPNISLARLCDLGKDPEIAWPIFQAVWSELTAPSQPNEGEGLVRPPMLMALDGLHHIMCESEYLDRDGKHLHAHNLALVQHFLSHLSGASPLANGGMILAATSGSNKAASPALDFALRRNEALASSPGADIPAWDPYRKIDTRSLEAMDGVEVWRIEGLSKEEARGVMEYYAKSGMMRQTVSDTLVGERWTLSGGGIVGELERGSVRMRI
ncbi:hypothetical protein LTR66_004395 [Elasticomyces elasticus]|nr:hypothetical protein LTR66_004395 [Elasticomyces elasticus]